MQTQTQHLSVERCALSVERFLLLLLAFGAVSAAAAQKPNVVVLLADDAGWGDYSHSGNKMVRTPQIDSLARDGVSLDRFFVCPLCAPTRSEFLTGRYYLRTGVRGVSTGHERLNADERTVADAFRAAGYATGAFGKWHNGSQWPYHPLARGFDTYYGYTAGHWGEYFDPPLERNGKMERAKGYIVDVCTDEALAFIERSRDKPFFCYVPFTTPHSPWAVPQEYWQRFKDKPLEQLATQPKQEKQDQTRCALAMLENQDWNVGRILKRLDDLKLADNTIVLYFSDNGPNGARWTGGMKGTKGGTDEGSVRSVCFLRWPAGLPKGRTLTEIAGAVDLLPTLTSLAGVARIGDKPLDGRNLTPLLLGQKVTWPDRTLFTAWGGKVSARTQQYRLDSAGALFDMLADPGQTKNVAAERPEATASLAQAAAAWRAEVYGADVDAKVEKNGRVDPRLLGVGYPEFPATMLPARDGEPRGCVKRSSGAPNSSYFVNWVDKSGEMAWQIDVQTTGDYDVVIDYTCPLADAGSLVELGFNGARLTGRVTPGWDPPLYTNQDTVERPHGESQMKAFRPLALGTIRLEKGAGPLTLRALEIPEASVMDVRRVTLTLKR
jgi:arylsulfatase A-like enzyme